MEANLNQNKGEDDHSGVVRSSVALAHLGCHRFDRLPKLR